MNVLRYLTGYLLHGTSFSGQPTLVVLATALVFISPVWADGLSVAPAPVVNEAVAPSTAYPAGSIQSVETANKALTYVEQTRASIQARFLQEQRACYDRFFANACVDAARERRRIALAEIRSIEIEANAFKRRLRATNGTKDRNPTEIRPDKAQPSKPSNPQSANSVEPIADLPQQSAGAEKNTPSDMLEESRPRRRSEKAAVDAQAEAKKREKNIEAYNRKQQKIRERQKELEAKKAEKKQKRASN